MIIQPFMAEELALYLSVSAILCLVAYLLGVYRRRASAADSNKGLHAVTRARTVAKELQRMAEDLNLTIRRHQTSIGSFQQSVTGSDTVDVHIIEEVVSGLRQLTADLGLARARIGEQTDRLKVLSESRIDPLTGIANRRAFEEELESLLAHYKAGGPCFALAFMDIDHFKSVNDTHGHPTGDKALQHVACILADNARQIDFVARTGGEEFGLLILRSDLPAAGHAMERIRLAVESTPLVVGIRMTISAGVAVPLAGESFQSLVDRADAALYCAKVEGRNRTYLQQDGLLFSPPSPVRLSTGLPLVQPTAVYTATTR